jgi:RNA polymerase sigma factor (sigma-70 family)
VSESKQSRSAGEVFADLYEEYLDRVFRYIHFRVNNTQVTEDLTSVVFEKALVHFDRYSSDKARFSTWIFSIARNVVIDYYRVNIKKQNIPSEALAETPSGDLTPEEEIEQGQEVKRLQDCLKQLLWDEQEIVRLKFWAELNNRQIAKMLGISETNVGTKLYRAVKKLRSCVQGT